jgi:hypothetical protein
VTVLAGNAEVGAALLATGVGTDVPTGYAEVGATIWPTVVGTTCWGS